MLSSSQFLEFAMAARIVETFVASLSENSLFVDVFSFRAKAFSVMPLFFVLEIE